jgi:hypothetical protein
MIFIVTDAVPNVPQTPEFFREAGHAELLIMSFPSERVIALD